MLMTQRLLQKEIDVMTMTQSSRCKRDQNSIMRLSRGLVASYYFKECIVTINGDERKIKYENGKENAPRGDTSTTIKNGQETHFLSQMSMRNASYTDVVSPNRGYKQLYHDKPTST